MDKHKDRSIEILKLLRQEGFLSINELAERISVSSMTIRRDLQQLEKEHLIKLLPGGAILNENAAVVRDAPYSLIAESCLHPEAKLRIGEKAAELVEPDDLIIIDSGTTTEYLARYIPDNMPLTILTYTLNILLEVYKRKSCKIIFAGGFYHDNTMMFECPEGINLIERTRAQKAFIGATGISDKLGVTCSNQTEPNVKRAVIKSSLEKILVIDSSKFGLVRSFYFAEISEFDTIITDDGIPQFYYDLISKLGKKVIIA
jgi:DeoR family transcriptional regulator, deoxyribose operon repressor